MKTVISLSNKRDNNNKLIGQLIEELHLIHLENQELDRQIQAIVEGDDNINSEEEEADSSTSIKSGDRAVVLSPHKQRKGTTGHVKSLSKNKGTANFKSDTNQEFSVRVGNPFRLKKKDTKR